MDFPLPVTYLSCPFLLNTGFSTDKRRGPEVGCGPSGRPRPGRDTTPEGPRYQRSDDGRILGRDVGPDRDDMSEGGNLVTGEEGPCSDRRVGTGLYMCPRFRCSSKERRGSVREPSKCPCSGESLSAGILSLVWRAGFPRVPV